MPRRRVTKRRRKMGPKYGPVAQTRSRFANYNFGTFKNRSYGKVNLHQFTIAQINPFDFKSYGAKIPDSNTMPSTAFFTQDYYGVASGSSNNYANAIALRPTINNNNIYTATQTSTTAWTWGATYGSVQSVVNAAQVQTLYDAVRPVAHGVRITCPVAPTSIQGEMHICLYPNSQAGNATWSFPTNVNQMQRLPSYKRIPLAELTQKPMIYVNKYMDDTAFRYFDPNDNFVTNLGNNSNLFDFGNQWCAIVIAIENPYSNGVNCLDVENLCHFEAIQKVGTTQVNQPSKPENSDPIALAATSGVVATIDPLIDRTEDTDQRFWSAACEFADRAQSVAVGAASGYAAGSSVAGPVGGAVGALVGAGRGLLGRRSAHRARPGRQSAYSVVQRRGRLAIKNIRGTNMLVDG